MNDPRERLRQYLEQRREMGESEFVLDSLPVDEALRVLTTGATPPATPPGRASAAAAGGSPTPRDTAPEPPRASRTEGVTEDWRSIVSAPDTPTAAPVPKPKSGRTAPSSPAREASSTPSEAPAGSPVDLSGARTLEEVAKVIAACKACTLSSTALNHVPGEGSRDAKFVVVGEAPGATEDELGRPFVGKSRDLLEKILEAIGFKRADVFIVNVLKHRPPGNRNPSPAEIVACRPFLLRQLDLLEPRVILALGTFAAQTLLESDETIGQLRGKEHTYHGIPLVATYHPAALLRNPNWKRPAWEDVQLARRIFDRA